MLVAALIDAGANEKKVVDAMRSAPKYLSGCGGVDVSVDEVRDHGLRALRLNVQAQDPTEHRTASEVKASLSTWLKEAGLGAPAKAFALGSLQTLITAEAKVHGTREDRVVLHESGNADTLVDVVGTAACLEDLRLFSADVYCTPVAVGAGLFKFSHGIVASPAPGALEILRGRRIPMVGGPVEAELTTPTGAALLANMVLKAREFYPHMKADSVGYGAGSKHFEAFPNLLRVVIGEGYERLGKGKARARRSRARGRGRSV